MEQSAFECVKALDVGPLPVIENTSSINKNICIMLLFAGRGARTRRSRDTHAPLARWFIPSGTHDGGVEGDQRIEVVPLGYTFKVASNFLGW